MNEVPPLRQDPPPKKTRNWLLIGCLGTVAVVFLLIAAVGIGGWFWFKSLTDRYTASAPITLPKVELSSAENSRLETKLQEVYYAHQNQQAVELELNSAELNATLAENADLKDRVWLEIRDGKLRGKVSIPLEASGMKALKGRWLNGDATLTLTSDGTGVRMQIETLTVNGVELPRQVLDGLREQNLVEDLARNGETAEYLKKIGAISLEDGKLRVSFKP